MMQTHNIRDRLMQRCHFLKETQQRLFLLHKLRDLLNLWSLVAQKVTTLELEYQMTLLCYVCISKMESEGWSGRLILNLFLNYEKVLTKYRLRSKSFGTPTIDGLSTDIKIKLIRVGWSIVFLALKITKKDEKKGSVNFRYRSIKKS